MADSPLVDPAKALSIIDRLDPPESPALSPASAIALMDRLDPEIAKPTTDRDVARNMLKAASIAAIADATRNPANRHWINEGLTSMVRGLIGTRQSLGGLAEFAGAQVEKLTGENVVSKFLQDYGEIEQRMATIYKETEFRRSPDSGEWFNVRDLAGDIGEAIPELFVQAGVTTAVGALTGGIGTLPALAAFSGTAAAPVVGRHFSEAKDFYISTGMSEEQANERASAEAGGAGFAEAATNLIPGVAVLRRFGGDTILKKTALGVARGFAGEGLQEAAAEVATKFVKDYNRENPELFEAITSSDPDYWKQVFRAFLVGGFLGSGLGAAKARKEFAEDQFATVMANTMLPDQMATIMASAEKNKGVPSRRAVSQALDGMEIRDKEIRRKMATEVAKQLEDPQDAIARIEAAEEAAQVQEIQDDFQAVDPKTPSVIRKTEAVATIETEPEAAPRRRPIETMTQEQLEDAFRAERALEKQVVVDALGEEDAKKLARLERRASGPFRTAEESKVEDAELDRLRNKLDEAAPQEQFEEDADDLRDAARSLGRIHGETADQIAETLKFTLTRLPHPELDPAEYTFDQRVAVAQINEARRLAEQHGIDTKELSDKTLQKAASRFDNPEDAAVVLEHLTDPLPPEAFVGAPQLPPAPTAPAEADTKYKPVGDLVDGLSVSDNIPNQESIEATFDDFEILPGVREIPMSEFSEPTKKELRDSAELAEQINESGVIDPLIVAVDDDGPYILEGSHRIDALSALGKKSIPAMVVIDKSPDPDSLTIQQQGENALRQQELDAVDPETLTKDSQKRLENQKAETKPAEDVDEPLFGDESGAVDLGKALKSGQSLLKIIRTNFGSDGHLGPLAKPALKKEQAVRAMQRQVKQSVTDMERALKKEYGGPLTRFAAAATGGRTLPRELQLRPIHQYLTHRTFKLERLPERLRAPAKKFRDDVDALSVLLRDSGMLTNELIATIDKNLGVYMKRSFRAFLDPKWQEKVEPAVRQDMKMLLHSWSPELTDQELDGELGKILDDARDAGNPIAWLARGKLGSKDLSVLKRRKDLPPELLAFLGEIDDPIVNYTISMEKIGNMIANHEMLTSLAEQHKDTLFFEKPIINEKGKFTRPISAEGNLAMAPLDGLHTTEELANAFENYYKPDEMKSWMRWYMKANGLSKFSKVVLSQQAVIRNLQSNLAFALAAGHWNVWKSGETMKIIANNLFTLKNEENRAFVNELIGRGIMQDSAKSGELKAIVGDILNDGGDFDKLMGRHIGSMVRRMGKLGAQKAALVYETMDDIWKVFGYLHELDYMKKAHPERSLEQNKDAAAENVRNMYPTWSKVPPAIVAIRKFAPVGPFVAFPWEVARTRLHTIRIAMTEAFGRNSNSTERLKGAQRIAGLVASLSLSKSVQATTASIQGISKSDEEDLRKLMADWSKNSNIMWLNRRDDDTYRFVDLGYVDPNAYGWNALNRAMRRQDEFDADRDLWDTAWETLLEASKPFYSEEILAQKVFDLMRNQKARGGPIWTDADSWTDKRMKQFLHLADAWNPGEVNSANRVRKGFNNEISPFGTEFNATDEAMAMFMGARISTINLPQSLRFKTGQYSKRVSSADSGLRRVATDQGAVSDEELRDAYRDSERARRAAFDTMTEIVSVMTRRGMPRRKIAAILMSRLGNNRKAVGALLNGNYRPYIPTARFLAQAQAGAAANPGRIFTPQEVARRRRIIIEEAVKMSKDLR